MDVETFPEEAARIWGSLWCPGCSNPCPWIPSQGCGNDAASASPAFPAASFLGSPGNVTHILSDPALPRNWEQSREFPTPPLDPGASVDVCPGRDFCRSWPWEHLSNNTKHGKTAQVVLAAETREFCAGNYHFWDAEVPWEAGKSCLEPARPRAELCEISNCSWGSGTRNEARPETVLPLLWSHTTTGDRKSVV